FVEIMNGNLAELPLYWKAPYQTTLITEIIDIKENNVALKQTIFYPGGGGQPCDEGILEFRNGESSEEFRIISTYKEDGKIWHKLGHKGNSLSPGQQVLLKLDWEKRYSLMRAHTAQHLFSHFIKKKFDCETLKANFEPFTIDIEVDKELSAENVFEVLSDVNLAISKNSKVNSIIISQEEYQQKYRNKIRGKDSKEDIVRLIEIEEIDDLVCCGGTHVDNLLEIQGIILQELKHNKIKLLIGEHGLSYANKQRDYVIQLEKITTKKNDKLISVIKNRFEDYIRVNDALVETLSLIFKNIKQSTEAVKNLNYTNLKLQNVNRETIINSIKSIPPGVFITLLGYNNILYFISTSDVSSADVVKKLQETNNYKGGGNQKFAQIKLKETEKIEEIEKKIRQIIENLQPS
ncbi:MAG: alanine--tRNA ligase-related protein, partial [Candidatus Heimdallarchaeaceae archaeon]